MGLILTGQPHERMMSINRNNQSRNQMYEIEKLDPINEDDGTIVSNVETLAESVIGHRIIGTRHEKRERLIYGSDGQVTILELDNGTQVELQNTYDCCAFTEMENVILNLDKVNHVITGVGTTEGYTKWHIYADLGDVVELQVSWSCGNPFYYGYGFDIQVKPLTIQIEESGMRKELE